MSEPVNTELELLREFYDAWVRLHIAHKDRLHHRQNMRIAEEIVDAHHALQRFQTPNDPELERRIQLVGSHG